MRAKFINEIVKGKESATAALGIGKAYMTKGYDYALQTWPDRFNSVKPYKETFELNPDIPHDNTIQTCYINFSISLERRLNINLDDYVWTGRSKRNAHKKDSFDYWADSLTTHRTKTTVNSRSFQYTAYFGYSEIYSLGYMMLQVGRKGNFSTAHNGYFLRYK